MGPVRAVLRRVCAAYWIFRLLQANRFGRTISSATKPDMARRGTAGIAL